MKKGLRGWVKEQSLMALNAAMIGAIFGVGASTAVQDCEAFGLWGMATGSSLGLTQLDWSRLGESAGIGVGLCLAAFLTFAALTKQS